MNFGQSVGFGNSEEGVSVLAEVLWKCILKDMDVDLALKNGRRM